MRGTDRRPRLLNALVKPGDQSVDIPLGGDGKYAFLSPFATWTIMFRATPAGSPLDLTDIESISVSFEGMGFAYAGVI